MTWTEYDEGLLRALHLRDSLHAAGQLPKAVSEREFNQGEDLHLTTGYRLSRHIYRPPTAKPYWRLKPARRYRGDLMYIPIWVTTKVFNILPWSIAYAAGREIDKYVVLHDGTLYLTNHRIIYDATGGCSWMIYNEVAEISAGRDVIDLLVNQQRYQLQVPAIAAASCYVILRNFVYSEPFVELRVPAGFADRATEYGNVLPPSLA